MADDSSNETGRSSLAVSQNAKGQFQISGKVYAQQSIDVNAELELLQDAVETALSEYGADATEKAADPSTLALDKVKGRLKYLESCVDLDGARQEMVHQVGLLATELRSQGFKIAGDD